MVADDVFGIEVVRGLECRPASVQIVYQAFAANEYPVGKVLPRVVGVYVAIEIRQTLVVVLLDILPARCEAHADLIYEIAVGEYEALEEFRALTYGLFGIYVGNQGLLCFHVADLLCHYSSSWDLSAYG